MGRENAPASGEKEASAEERRSLRSKRFQSSYCAKVGAKATKKNGRGRGRGMKEEEGFLFSPSPSVAASQISPELVRNTSQIMLDATNRVRKNNP